MYDRYTIFSDTAEVAKFFAISIPDVLPTHYNAYPTAVLPVVTSTNPNELQYFHWGQTQQLANNKSISPRLFNLTKDSAFARPAYRKAIQQNRCVIPANGFYVWKQLSKKQKTPYFCHFQHHVPFGIAGIFEEFEDIEGKPSRTFNMLTVPATFSLLDYQEDMPAILNKDQSERWLKEPLNDDEVMELLNTINDQKLLMHSVSPRITDHTSNDEGLIQPSAPTDQFGNYTLFS